MAEGSWFSLSQAPLGMPGLEEQGLATQQEDQIRVWPRIFQEGKVVFKEVWRQEKDFKKSVLPFRDHG